MCGFTILYPATENRHNLILYLAREINLSRVPPPKKIPAGATDVNMLFMNFQNFVLNARLTVACKWL